MKTYLLLFYLLFVFTSTTIEAQTLDAQKMAHLIEKELANYSCEDKDFTIMHPTLFKEQLESIFNTVVLNNSDLISNGSAIAFSQDKDKGTLSFNTTVNVRKNWYLDLGFSYENKENFSLNLYTKNALANDLGLRLGVLYRISGSQFKHGDSCGIINTERQRFMRLQKLNEYRILANTNLIQLQVELERIEETDATTDQSMEEKKKQIAVLKAKISRLNKIISNPEQTIVDEFKTYDKKYVVFNGYAMHWLNLNGTFKNARINDKLLTVVETADLKKNDDVFRMNLELSYNYFHDNFKFVFLQFFYRINRNTLLDAPEFRDKTGFTVTQNNLNQQYFVTQGYYQLFPYADLDRPYLESQLGGQVVTLLNKKKTYGFTCRVSYNRPIKRYNYVQYTDTFNFLLGPTFRSNGSGDGQFKLSQSTLSILCGFEQVPLNVSIMDLFSVKVSIGIPFTFYKSKSKP